MALISRLGVVLGLDTAEFNKNLGKAQDGLKKFATGAGVVGTALAAVGFDAIKFADQILDIAEANEVAVETVLELSTAITLGGGEAENVGKLFSTLTNKLDEASTGNKRTEESFAKLGISISNIRQLSIDELFRKTLDSLAAIENPITRNAMAMDIFGKAIKGTNIPLMNDELIKLKGTFDGTNESFKKAGDAFEIFDRIMIKFKAGTANELSGTFLAWSKGVERFVQMLTAAKTELINLFDAGSVIEKKLKDDRKNAGVLEDYTGKINFEQRTSPRKSSDEIAKDEKERLDAIAKRAKVIAMAEAKQAEADRQKIKDDEKLKEKLKSKNETLQQNKTKLVDDLNNQLAVIKLQNAELDTQKSTYEKIKLEFAKTAEFDTAKSKALKEQILLQAKEYDLAVETKANVQAIYDLDVERTRYLQEQFESNRFFQQSVDDVKNAAQRLDYERELGALSTIQTNTALAYFDLRTRLMRMSEASVNMSQQEQDNLRIQIDLMAEAEQMRIQSNESLERAQRTFQFGWAKAYADFEERAQDSAAIGSDSFNSMTQNINSSLDSFVRNGKLSFADFTTSVIQDLLRIQLRASATNLFGSLFGGSSGGLGNIIGEAPLGSAGTGSGIMGFISGMFRADGGDINANSPYIVGERGAELIVPRNSGTVIPNHALGGMMNNQPQTVYNGTVIQNMNAIDTKSFEERIYQSSNAVWAANAYANKSMPTTGGRT